MSTLRTNAILDASGGTTATVNGIPLRPGVLDPENRIINGAFDFWQRGTSFGPGFTYGPDRWINVTNAGTVTMSRQAFALGDTLGSSSPTYFVRQSVSGQTTAGSVVTVAQRIESVRSYAGQTITILGWARRSSGSGNMAVSMDQNFGTGGSPSAAVNGIGPATVTLTGSWSPFAVTISLSSVTGKTLGANNNDYLQLNFYTSAGSDFNSQSNSLGLQTIGVDLWGIHIKQGTHTTSAMDLYRQPELGPELARCQRYYQRVDAAQSSGNFTRYANGMVVSSTSASFFLLLPTRMRANPALTALNLFVWEGTGQWAVSSLVIGSDGTNPASVSLSATGTGGTTYRPAQLMAANTINSFLAFDAEL